MINKILQKLIRNICALFGINIKISKLTNPNELNDFLVQLYPVKTDIPLIRVGSKGDGGYLIPDDFSGVDALFSPGVGSKQDLDFEFATNGMKVFMADASVDGPVKNHENFSFEKKFVGSLDNDLFISIEEWVKSCSLKNSTDFILQMDIEGAEYETIYSIPTEIMKSFRIMIIEFHQLDFLFNHFMFDKFKNTFLKILQTHYCVHIHPNNCSDSVVIKNIEIPPVLEFTFIRKDRANIVGFADQFPHNLDADCTDNQTLVLPSCWYNLKNETD